MKIHLRKKRKDINIADSGALSDLAFLLIIFFIVIAVFTVNQGFVLGIPRKDSTKIINNDDIIKVILNAKNELILDGNKISFEEIEDILQKKLATKPKMTFFLKIDKNAKYQNVVDVFNIIQKLDIENFSFKMMQEEEK